MKASIFAAALAVAGEAAAAERLRGFDALAANSTRIELTGAGAGERGSFRLGEAGGRFERKSIRLRREGERIGRAALRFQLAGPGLQGVLAGECYAGEAAVHEQVARDLAVTTTFALPRIGCRFTLEGRPAGTLDLHEGPARSATVREERRGVLTWAGRSFAVRSVHHFAGSRWPAGAPLGYVVEQRDRAVAGVDVSGTQRVLLLPGGGEGRLPALAATMALALMWDAEAE